MECGTPNVSDATLELEVDRNNSWSIQQLSLAKDVVSKDIGLQTISILGQETPLFHPKQVGS